MNVSTALPSRTAPPPAAFAGAPPAPQAQEPDQAVPGAERALLDAADRVLKSPAGKVAMALHLSRLKAPAPRPYHLRIAQALMQDTAARLGGQIFPVRNGDLVLLCGTEGRASSAAPAELSDSLRQLFGIDAPGPALTTIWPLAEAANPFRDYLAQALAEPTLRERPSAEPANAAGLPELMARIIRADPRTLLIQQTAVQLRAGHHAPLAAGIAPVFREIVFSPGSLQPGIEAALLANPFILRHVAAVMHPRMVLVVLDDLREDGPLTRPALLLNMPIHLNLSPHAVMSPEFARLAQHAASYGVRFGIEFNAMDVAADPDVAAFARALLRQAGFVLVLDGVDHASLPIVRAESLAPDLLKLAWSPRLLDGQPDQLAPISAAIKTIGPHRIVLQDVDSEAAITWAHARGITCFQGHYLDAVQAASRIAVCPGARACSLRLCTRRGLALHPASRAGCGYPGLLDMTPFAGGARASAAP